MEACVVTTGQGSTLFRKKNESANTLEYVIQVKENKTIVRKIYLVPHAYGELVSRAINDMLLPGIIERSDSTYCNSLRVVVKNNKTVRVCRA